VSTNCLVQSHMASFEWLSLRVIHSPSSRVAATDLAGSTGQPPLGAAALFSE
jgi:hypothetical protein